MNQKSVGCCLLKRATLKLLRRPLSGSDPDVERRDEFSDEPTPSTSKANTNHQSHDDNIRLARDVFTTQTNKIRYETRWTVTILTLYWSANNLSALMAVTVNKDILHTYRLRNNNEWMHVPKHTVTVPAFRRFSSVCMQRNKGWTARPTARSEFASPQSNTFEEQQIESVF